MGMRQLTGTRPAWWPAAAVALGAGLLAVACGSSSPTASGTSPSGTPSASSASPTATSELCQDAANLRGSIRKLTYSGVSKGDAATIKAYLAQVRSDLTVLTTHAKGYWQ